MKRQQAIKLGTYLTITSIATLAMACGKISSDLSALEPSETATSGDLLVDGYIAPSSKSGTPAVTQSSSAGVIVVAKEYHHKTLDRYFITTRYADQQIVEVGALRNEWEITGKTYTLFESQIAGTFPVCRFYIPETFAHFYTADVAECAQFKNTASFVYEGVEGFAAASNCGSPQQEVYRALSPATDPTQRRHRFTSDVTVFHQLLTRGWLSEGVAFCIADNQIVIPSTTTTTLPSTTTTTMVPTPTTMPPPGSTTTTTTLPPANPQPGGDLCPQVPVHADLNASTRYLKMMTGDYSSYGGRLNSVPVMPLGGQFIIRLTIDPTTSTQGTFPAGFAFADIGPERGGRAVTISRTKCDYSESAIWVSGYRTGQGPIPSNSSSISLIINESRPATPGTNEEKINSGVWYINIKNVACPANSRCDVVTEWAN